MFSKFTKPLLFVASIGIFTLCSLILVEGSNFFSTESEDSRVSKVDVVFVMDLDPTRDAMLDNFYQSVEVFNSNLSSELVDGKMGLVGYKKVEAETVKIDLSVILDTTGSMEAEVDAIKTELTSFGEALSSAGLDSELGLTLFTDRLFVPPKVDIGIALDVTSGMEKEKDRLSKKLMAFNQALVDAGIDARIGIGAFDNYDENGEQAIQLLKDENNKFLRRDIDQLALQVEGLSIQKGGLDESSLLGLYRVMNAMRKEGSVSLADGRSRVLVLITDEQPLIPDGEVESFEFLTDAVADFAPHEIFLLSDERHEEDFSPLAVGTSLTKLPIAVNRNRVDFDGIMESLTRQLVMKFGYPGNVNGAYGLEPTEALRVIVFDNMRNTTSQMPELQDVLDGVTAKGGGDSKESIYDALAATATVPHRPESIRYLVLVTDASPLVPDLEQKTTQVVKKLLEKANKDDDHRLVLVVDQRLQGLYQTFESAIPIEYYDLIDDQGNRSDLESILQVLAERITSDLLAGSTSARRDSTDGSDAVLSFSGDTFTNNSDSIRQGFSDLRSLNAPLPENSYDAVMLALDQQFRSGSERVMVLITDKPALSGTESTFTTADVAERLDERHVKHLHLITTAEQKNQYQRLTPGAEDSGLFFELPEDTTQSFDFSFALKELAQNIETTNAPKPLTSAEQERADKDQRHLFWTMWMAAIGFSIGSGGALAHACYLPTPRGLAIRRVVSEGLRCAFVLGVLAWFGPLLLDLLLEEKEQFLFGGSFDGVTDYITFAVVFSFGVCVATIIVAKSTTNTGNLCAWTSSLAAALCCSLAYYGLKDLGPLLTRAGTALAVVGFSGLGIVVAERLSGRIWLELESESLGRKKAIALGEMPFLIGSDKKCDLRLKNVLALQYRFFLNESIVYAVDLERQTVEALAVGSEATVGDVTIRIVTQKRQASNRSSVVTPVGKSMPGASHSMPPLPPVAPTPPPVPAPPPRQSSRSIPGNRPSAGSGPRKGPKPPPPPPKKSSN